MAVFITWKVLLYLFLRIPMLLWNCNFKSVLLVAGYRLAGRLHPTSCYPLYSVPHDLLHCPTLCTRASSYGQPFPTISSDHMDTSTTHTSLINRYMTELPDKMSQTPGRTTQNIAHVPSIPISAPAGHLYPAPNSGQTPLFWYGPQLVASR